MSKITFEQLLEKYFSETMTKDEQALFFEQLRLPENEAFLTEGMQKDWKAGPFTQQLVGEEIIRERLKADLLAQLTPQAPVVPLKATYRRGKWMAAAAVVLLVALGGYFFLQNWKESQVAVTPLRVGDIAPGSDKAILTLADGRQILLDSAANGNLAQQGNAQVVKLADGQIVYNVKGLAQDEAVMNTLRTPNGGQYKLTLPDGTNVWMNAASSITYPTVFTGKKREVKVSGELYFEVAKNAERPFVVDVNGQSSVEVLGTHFNINAYEIESISKTTLVEGKVKVTKGSQSNFLYPGEQARIDSSITIASSVSIDQVLAWKNGKFSFEGMQLPEVMRQLERWYNIQVRYEGTLPAIKFHGKMSRGVNLSDVIKFLSDNDLKLKLEGRTLIVL